MSKNTYKRSFVWLCLLLMAVPVTLFAHGGGEMRVAGIVSGPYKLTVWTAPPQATTQTPIHITVGVADVTDDSVIIDAHVTVLVYAPEIDDPIVTAVALNTEGENRLFYEADFRLTNDDTYLIEIVVTGPRGEGMTTFNLKVNSNQQALGLTVGLIVLGLGTAVVLFRLWARQTVSIQPVRPQKRKQ